MHLIRHSKEHQNDSNYMYLTHRKILKNIILPVYIASNQLLCILFIPVSETGLHFKCIQSKEYTLISRVFHLFN